MKQRPILFSTPMVKAILADLKKMTRRTKGFGEVNEQPDDFVYLGNSTNMDVPRPAIKYDTSPWFMFTRKNSNVSSWIFQCPYGQVGDVLWVRETFRKYFYVDPDGYTHFDDERIDYAADNPEPIRLIDADGFGMTYKDGSERYVPWKPSIHMPKIACRIFLEITNIRVERLKDISDEDALREGIQGFTKDKVIYKYGLPGWDWSIQTVKNGKPNMQNKPWKAFSELWESINDTGSWNANPWVWVISFKKINNPNV